MIAIDDREVLQHPEIPELLGIPCIVQRLGAGDYAFNDRNSEPLGIERCEIGNLVQKLRSGELEDQMYRCQDFYASIILLIEGVYDQYGELLAVYRDSSRGYFRTHIYPNTQYDYIKALEIRLSEMGIELIYAPNFQCSMATIRVIYNQRTKPEEEHRLFKRARIVKLPVKLSANPAVPKLMALASRFPEKVAIRLINKYDTIWSILNAPEKELLEVEGMGKGLLANLKKGVGKE